jgi:hypothetical protein
VEKVKIINKHSVILFICALAINFIFLYFNHKNIFCNGQLRYHQEMGYNVFKYNSVKLNWKRIGAICKKEGQNKKRADYYEIDHEKHGPPTEYMDQHDTIGYGVLIGLVWKVTRSLNLLDIQILQILIFSLLMFLFYQIAFFFFKKKKIAFMCGISLLFFLPVIYLNVQANRDIWPYYAGVIILYSILKYFFGNGSWKILLAGGSLFGLIQWMRQPLVFPMILTITTISIFYMLIKKYSLKKIFLFFAILIGTNILFFWIPNSTYNKIVHDKYFVGPVGINLLTSLGEFPNKWGYEMGEGWFCSFMKKNFNIVTYDNECEEKAIEIFWQSVKEEPLFYIKTIIKRIPRLLFPGLPWFNYKDTVEIYTLYVTGTPISQLVKLICRSPVILIDFASRHIYVGIYLLLAYLGMLFAFIRKKYIFLSFVYLGIIVSSYSTILTHTEHRYLIPAFAFFSLFVGYFIHLLCTLFRKRKTS